MEAPTHKNLIYARMREARKRVRPKVTLADLSARIETYGVYINPLSLSRIETGKRTVLDFELRAIAASLAVTMGWLAGEEDVHDDTDWRKRGGWFSD